MTVTGYREALKPCPYCKCADVRMSLDRSIFAGQVYVDEPGDEGWKARCEKCGCQTCWWHSEEQAIAAWNTRAADPAPVLTVEEIARIVDPEAWTLDAWNDNWRAVIAKRQTAARAKATAILSLIQKSVQPAHPPFNKGTE